MKGAAIAFAVSAACSAILSVVQFASGHPVLGVIWLAVTAGWVVAAIAIQRSGTSGEPPV